MFIVYNMNLLHGSIYIYLGVLEYLFTNIFKKCSDRKGYVIRMRSKNVSINYVHFGP